MDTEPTIFVVDADDAARDGVGSCLRHAGLRTEEFACPNQLLDGYDPARPGCLILEMHLSGMSALELRQTLLQRGCHKPFIILTASGSVADAVQAMRDGAVDFLEKPYRRQVLLERVHQALEQDSCNRQRRQEQLRIRTELATLTLREREVLQLVVAGFPTREIAAQLGLSPKTIEVHRSNIVGKMRVDSIAELEIMLARKQIELPTPIIHRRRA